MGRKRRTPEVTKQYDAEADVLYVSFGEPRPAAGWEPEEDIIVRQDPESGEIVGVTIIHWQSRFGGSMEAVKAALEGQVPDSTLGLVTT